jgi:hypothetical protein
MLRLCILLEPKGSQESHVFLSTRPSDKLFIFFWLVILCVEDYWIIIDEWELVVFVISEEAI